MRVLMLVWTGVATDTRVLREAAALVDAGHTVHIIGRAVPATFEPRPGITTSSVGRPPLAEGRTRALRPPERLARWLALPNHVARRLHGWQVEVLDLARSWASVDGAPDVVHAHDYTALGPAGTLATEWGVPLVYDTHEYWVGRPVEGRPAPLLRRREARDEARLGARAAAVITVGQGVADALREDHPDWPEIHVVRNTFPERADLPAPGVTPRRAVYAGRLAAYRELETVAAASRLVDLPIDLVGPQDQTWLAAFDPGRATVHPARSVGEVDELLIDGGLALVTHSDRWENHRLAMPNKLFHAVNVGVPVVATDVGELGRIVRKYGIGRLYRPGDPADLVRAIGEAVAEYGLLCQAVRDAAAALSWTADAKLLTQIYVHLEGNTMMSAPGSADG